MAQKKLISKKELWAILLVNSLVIGASAIAADTATVAATVTAQKVSISVTDGAVAYGTVGLGASKDTTSAGVDDTQTVTNDGNVAEDINIKGQNSANWTIGAAAGENIFVHDYCVAGSGSPDLCDAGAVWNHLGSADYSTLGTDVAASGTQKFDLKITMPSSTTNYAAQNVDVVVQASAAI